MSRNYNTPKNKIRSAIRYHFKEQNKRWPNNSELKSLLLNPPDSIVEKWGFYLANLYEKLK